MAAERRFRLDRNYQAVFTFPTEFDDEGNVITTATFTTYFTGININKFGLKKLIYNKATKLNMPRGYRCKVDG